MILTTLDTETCGLCGPAIILQYAFDDGEIRIHNFWKETIDSSLKLIEKITETCVVGFNLAFDWFQICKIYTMFQKFIETGGDLYSFPEDHIETLANLEADARFGPCVKPKAAIDLMLHARKTKYQITMNRSDIRIRRVPTVLATLLAKHLEQEVVLQGILFARRKDKYAPKWRVYDCVKRIGGKETVDPDFKDVVLKFKPSVALKALAIDALGVQDDQILLFHEIEVDRAFLPNEIPYAPFAKAVRDIPLGKGSKTQARLKKIYKYRDMPWRWAWPDVIQKHIDHWEYNDMARTYASKDVEYTRGLYHHFGKPEIGDDDSVLACMVGAVRWKGYSINVEGLKNLKQEALTKIKNTPMAPRQVKYYLSEVLDPAEIEVLNREGTKKVVLEALAKRKNEACPMCAMLENVDPDCDVCKGTNKYTHPVAERAQEVLDARMAKKEKELYDKLILAGRFHASFKVIGTLSSRMSGTDGLNAQGIKRTTSVRKNFTFADEDTKLVGGDFDGFEVVIAEAAYKDPDLREALLKKATCPGCKGKKVDKKGNTCKDCKGEGQTGQKIHGLFAMELFPGRTYEEIVESKGSKFDMYDYGKRGVFSQIYGGNEVTLVNKLEVSLEVAKRASTGFLKRFPKMAEERRKIENRFASMRQPNGIGSRVEWHDPDEAIESLLGFKRYFTLENQVCKALYLLANKPPKSWKNVAAKIKLIRRDREQTASGALASALYSAAFQLQAANVRAAANHVIQSTGATITKKVQRDIWDIQPSGIHKWLVQPCNVHDEILCVIDPSVEEQVCDRVASSVNEFRSVVSMLKMEWKAMSTWAEK